MLRACSLSLSSILHTLSQLPLGAYRGSLKQSSQETDPRGPEPQTLVRLQSYSSPAPSPHHRSVYPEETRVNLESLEPTGKSTVFQGKLDLVSEAKGDCGCAIIPGLRRQGLEDCQFEGSLSYAATLLQKKAKLNCLYL